MALIIHQCFLTKNDCYRAGRTITPKGIVVHSTGANNPYLRRYVQPDDGILGKNPYDNDWNRPGLDVCVNAFIGLDKNKQIQCYQTLPWNMRPWGVGSGKNGSYNNSHIQFEICEDDLSDAAYCKNTFETAAQLCAYLCCRYHLAAESIVSHHEAHERGYGSDHTDPDNWWPKHGLSMDIFRERVRQLLSEKEEVQEVRYEKLKDVTDPVYRATLEKLIEKGLLVGRGGEGEDLVLELSEDSVRILVVLDRAGAFDTEA